LFRAAFLPPLFTFMGKPGISQAWSSPLMRSCTPPLFLREINISFVIGRAIPDSVQHLSFFFFSPPWGKRWAFSFLSPAGDNPVTAAFFFPPLKVGGPLRKGRDVLPSFLQRTSQEHPGAIFFNVFTILGPLELWAVLFPPSFRAGPLPPSQPFGGGFLDNVPLFPLLGAGLLFSFPFFSF